MSQAQKSSPTAAEMYEQGLVKVKFAPLADSVLRLVHPGPGDRVLDVACGTGIVLRKAAPFVVPDGKLAGIDLNPAMLEVARAKAGESGISAEWREAFADAMPFVDMSFNWVYCQNGFQFFPDKHAALLKIHRVLEENGTMVLIVWKGFDHHPYIKAIDDVAFQQTGIHLLQVPFSLGDAGELARMIDDAGFRESSVELVSITSRAEDPEMSLRAQITGAMAAIPSLRSLDNDERPKLVQNLLDQAKPVLDAYTVDGVLTVDWFANVAIARR